MAPSDYSARITRLVGPGTTTLFEVELQPPGRLPGQVPNERIRVLIEDDRDAPPERIAMRAREVLASVAAVEWPVVRAD
jgi:hypothetical protein